MRMIKRELDLLEPHMAYLVGLLQTDGYHYQGTRNRGKLSLEANIQDVAIAETLATLLPVRSTLRYRTRTTSFQDGKYQYKYETFVWTISDWGFRDAISPFVPVGKKAETISPPDCPFSLEDYWRGVIDGDAAP